MMTTHDLQQAATLLGQLREDLPDRMSLDSDEWISELDEAIRRFGDPLPANYVREFGYWLDDICSDWGYPSPLEGWREAG